MAKRCDVVPSRTYATEENLERAVNRLQWPDELRYHVSWTKEGRCYPIFIGASAVHYGVHFHYPVLG